MVLMPDLKSTIIDLWTRGAPSPDMAATFILKLRRLKVDLRKQRGTVGDIFQRKKKLMNRIQALDKQEEDFSISAEDDEQQSHLKLQLANIISQEETYKWQRSRNQWIKDGDRNIKFFHIDASNQKRENEISETLINGQLVSDQEKIQEEFLFYF